MELELKIGEEAPLRRVAGKPEADAIANRVQRVVKDAILAARRLKAEDVTACVLTCDDDFAVNSAQLPKAASAAVRAAFEAE